MAGGHDMGLIHLSPPEAKKIVLCRPIIHDFSLKMASPRLPACVRACTMRRYTTCTAVNSLPCTRTSVVVSFFKKLGTGYPDRY